MEQWIERYIRDVTRRLPEKEREDIARELKANIYDMLPEQPTEADVKAVLQELGAPGELAEKYRQKPRYLISPAMFDEYLRVLKWLLPLVGLICMGVGLALGVVEWAQEDGRGAISLIAEMISKGISTGVSGAFWTAVWVTIGFVVADRTGKLNQEEKDWSVESLPELEPEQGRHISLSGSIVELMLTLVFGVLAALCCAGIFPLNFVYQSAGEPIPVFDPAFLRAGLPVVIVMMAVELVIALVKVHTRRWTPLTCGVSVGGSLISMGAMLYWTNAARIFSEPFINWLADTDWEGHENLWLSQNGGHLLPIVISAIIVICSLIGIGTALYKTLKPRWNPKSRGAM